MSAAARRAAQTVKALLEDKQEQEARPEYALVRDTSPLTVELIDGELTLEEDDIVIGKAILGLPIEEGDTVVGCFTGEDDEFVILDVMGDRVEREAINSWSSIPDGDVGVKTVNMNCKGGDIITVGPPTNFQTGLIAFGFVTAANQVEIRVMNGSGGAVTPNDGTWSICVTPR